MKNAHLSMRDLRQIVAKEVQSGKSEDEIVRYLTSRGWPETSAKHFISNALSKKEEAPTTERAYRDAEYSTLFSDGDEKDEAGDAGSALLWVAALTGIVLVGLSLASNGLLSFLR